MKAYQQPPLAALIVSTYVSHRLNGIMNSDRYIIPLVQDISERVQQSSDDEMTCHSKTPAQSLSMSLEKIVMVVLLFINNEDDKDNPYRKRMD